MNAVTVLDLVIADARGLALTEFDQQQLERLREDRIASSVPLPESA
jgi:hypothetical protein